MNENKKKAIRRAQLATATLWKAELQYRRAKDTWLNAMAALDAFNEKDDIESIFPYPGEGAFE